MSAAAGTRSAGPVAEPTGPVSATSATRVQLRGSTLLLAGRILSVGINALIQVLIVRYLTKAEFGAFAFALSLAMNAAAVATFGLDRAVTRFVPIYEEHGEHGKVVGTVVWVAGAVLALGLALVALVYGLQAVAAGAITKDPRAVSVLLVLILLAPVQALDTLLVGMFAVFARPRAIFVRRYVLTPVLRLTVVLLLIAGGSGVTFLAAGYVLTGAIGVALYGVVLLRLLRARGLMDRAALSAIELPWREVLAFTIPLLTTDLVYVVMTTSDAVLLGFFGGAKDVADFRAIWPVAQLNLLVSASFALLFTPLAARLFARGDRAGLNELYWQTAVWTAVLSFPLFALTFGLARPVTLALFGARYEGSATFLAILSAGFFLRAALGFNGLTLRVFGLVRYTVVVNLIAIAANLVLNVVLIGRFGALGAALGTCGAVAVHTFLLQHGLRRGTGVNRFPRRYARAYGAVAVTSVAVLAVGIAVRPSLPVGLVLVLVASAAVLLVSRPALQVGRTFPELLRLPLVRALISRR